MTPLFIALPDKVCPAGNVETGRADERPGPAGPEAQAAGGWSATKAVDNTRTPHAAQIECIEYGLAANSNGLPLLPQDNAQRHVRMIGRDKILGEVHTAMDSGGYRWAVQVLHHLVFADPDDTEAKDLQADAYEQLGYHQEVPQYRAIFLTAAKELREGDDMEKLLLSPAEAAAHLSIGRSKVYKLMRLGQLRSVKIGALRRIPQAALADFIAALTEEPR
jgi:excisionase family DNA binding protein